MVRFHIGSTTALRSSRPEVAVQSYSRVAMNLVGLGGRGVIAEETGEVR